MFNNDDPTVTVCSNLKHSFPVKDYIVMANRTVADLFMRILWESRAHFFNTVRLLSEWFQKSLTKSI